MGEIIAWKSAMVTMDRATSAAVVCVVVKGKMEMDVADA